MREKLEKRFSEMVSAYCKLKGMDENEFLEECEQKFGKEGLIVGVLDIVKSDKPLIEFADQVCFLASLKDEKIPTARETSESIQGVLAFDDGDEELVDWAIAEMEKNRK